MFLRCQKNLINWRRCKFLYDVKKKPITLNSSIIYQCVKYRSPGMSNDHINNIIIGSIHLNIVTEKMTPKL